MTTDCKKKLEDFNFKEEAEVPGLALRIISKLESPKNAVDEYTFLETIAEQIPEANSDIFEPKTIPDADVALTVVKELPLSHTERRADLSRSEVNPPTEADFTATVASALPSNVRLISSELNEAVSVDSHEHKSMCERSSATCSAIAEDDGICGPSSDHCTGEWEMDDEDLTTVVFYPDHMVYCDSDCTNCVLTFTNSCIRMEGSASDGDDKFFKFEWGIQELLHIKSHWYELVGMVMVTVTIHATQDRRQAENAEYPAGTKLKFTVIGTNWHERQEAITSLNVAYKALWSSMLESEDTVHGHSQVSFAKYFPNFDQPFEEVIYPKGDADAVSISKRDVDLLLPDTFVNDTIIDFYIKYLKNKIKPEEKQRFHFFNSFFFRKLADPDKDKLDAFEGKAAFQRVKKWTRKVNLFEKDYVFIPVNYNYHWSLIVMCHLGEVATYKDEVNELVKVPCVLHMDSIKGSHTGLKGLMQSYLKEEWKGRHHEASEDISSKFDNLRFISLELPQQPNSFDCGLFLLHYVELFLEEAPINFNPFKITKNVNFLNVDWFPPADASLKRVVIQRLVYDLLDDKPSHEAPPSMATNDENHNFTSLATNIHAVNFFPQTCNPSMPCQDSQTESGIGISLLPSFSIISNEPCAADPNVALRPSFEPGSFLSMNFPSFNETTLDQYKNSLMPPIQEDMEGSAVPWHAKETSEASISGCEDSLQAVNRSDPTDAELGFEEEPRSPPLTEPIQRLDGNDNGCDNSNLNGFSEESESDVLHHHHPTKKMRITIQQPLEGEEG